MTRVIPHTNTLSELFLKAKVSVCAFTGSLQEGMRTGVHTCLLITSVYILLSHYFNHCQSRRTYRDMTLVVSSCYLVFKNHKRINMFGPYLLSPISVPRNVCRSGKLVAGQSFVPLTANRRREEGLRCSQTPLQKVISVTW